MNTITVNDAVSLMRNSKGKFFTVSFVKRSDNSYRTMNCRLGVKRNLSGKKNKRRNVGLITVYELGKKDYRNVNVSGLRELKINGKDYKIV
jgi:hypothetical protein